MAKVKRKRKKVIRHNIVFDTNMIRGDYMSQEVLNLIKSYSGSEKFKLNFYITKIVKREFEKYVKNRISSVLGSYERLRSNAPEEVARRFPKPELKPGDHKKIVKKLLNENGFKVLRTPISKMKITELVSSAIEGKDKLPGIQDLATGEAILHNYADLARSGTVSFILRDEPFEKHMGNRSELKGKKLKIFKSIENFESWMRSEAEGELREDDLKRLTEIVEDSFYSPHKPHDSLYARLQVRSELAKKLPKVILQEGFTVDDAYLLVSRPVYQEKQDSFLVWKTKISLRFEKTRSYAISGPQVDEIEKIYRVDYDVLWKFKSSNGKISEPSIEEVVMENYSTEDRSQRNYLFPYSASPYGLRTSGISYGSWSPTSTPSPSPSPSFWSAEDDPYVSYEGTVKDPYSEWDKDE